MAALRQAVNFIFISTILSASPSFGQEPNLPTNVLEQDPLLRYYVWWKPYRVIFDREKVIQIQKQIGAIATEDAETVNLDDAFRENRTSAFLFPVLATHGGKGTVILERFLRPYDKGKELDDEWLLIIASLGRIPTPQAQRILEKQLDRILKVWKPTKLVTVKGRQIKVPNRDTRTPVVEALIACLAGQKKLTAKYIDSLCREKSTFAWETGLEWANQLMPEKSALQLIKDGLNMCDEKELLKAMDLQVSSERLMGITYFLSGPKDVWHFTEKLLFTNITLRPEVLDFLIIRYMYILRYKAEIGNGVYPLDERIARVVSQRKGNYHGKLGYISKILLGCKPSRAYPQWQQFLTRHAAKLDPAYDPSVETEIKRVHGTEERYPKSTYDRREGRDGFESIKQPGVHMHGFRGGRF